MINNRLDHVSIFSLSFIKVDVEMSFTTADGIIDLIETLLVAIWPSFAGSLSIPFPRITYQEALAKYGSDKPDLRSDIEVCP